MEGRSVTIPDAAMQFFVESMRANTKVLENVNESLRGVQEEARQQLRLITEVRERVIRIEAMPSVHNELRDLRDKVAELEKKNVQDATRAATWTWIVKYAPSLMGLIVTVIASVLIVLVASGQLRVTSPATPPAPLPTDQR